MTVDELKVVIQAETSNFNKNLNGAKIALSDFAKATEKTVTNKISSISSKTYKMLKDMRSQIDLANSAIKSCAAGIKYWDAALVTSGPKAEQYEQKMIAISRAIDTQRIVMNRLMEIDKEMRKVEEGKDDDKTLLAQQERTRELKESLAIFENLRKELKDTNEDYKKFSNSGRKYTKFIKELMGPKYDKNGEINPRYKEYSEVLKNQKKLNKENTKETGRWSGEMGQLVKKFSLAHIAIQAIEKAIRWVVDAIKGAVNAMNFSDTTGEFRKTFNEFKAALRYLKDSLGAAFAPVIRQIIPAFTQLLNIVTKLTDKLGEINAKLFGSNVVYKAKKQVDEYGNAIDAVEKKLAGFDELNTIGETSSEFDIQSIEGSTSALVDAFKPLGDLLESIIGLFSTITDTILPVAIKSTETISNIIKKIVDLVNKVIKNIGPGLSEVIGVITKILDDVLTIVMDIVSSIIDNIPESFWASINDLLLAVADTISIIWDIIMKLIEPLRPVIDGILGTAIGQIASALGMVLDILSPLLNLINIILEAISLVINLITDIFTFNWDNLGEDVSGFCDKVSNTWGKFMQSLKNFGNNFINFWKSIGSFFVDIWDGIVGAFKTAINFVIKGLNKISFDIPDWVPLVGGKKFGINIPLLANGGVIDNPTLAMLGEYSGASSNPEIAAPERLLRNILNEGNADLADVFIQVGRQIIASIEDKDLEVNIDNETIASAAAKGNKSYFNRTGKELLSM